MNSKDGEFFGMTGDAGAEALTNPPQGEAPSAAPSAGAAEEQPRSDILYGGKKKAQRRHRSKRAALLALLLLLCASAGGLSGAFSSFFVLNRWSENLTQQPLPEATTQANADAQSEQQTTIIYIESSTAEPESEQTQPETQPETTAAPPAEKTKGEIYYEAVNSVVGIKSVYNKEYRTIFGQSYTKQYGSTGSGFFITDDGYIVTNYHVIENGTDITVSTYDGKSYKANIVGSDSKNDIAVIKIDAWSQAVTLGSSDSLSVGDDIMVIGNALGSLSYSFTDGIVSHLARSITMTGGTTMNMFQTNAAINSGNSGGPVYNMDGEVIGIASAKYASDSIEGLGFCIPIDDVKDIIVNIIYRAQ